MANSRLTHLLDLFDALEHELRPGRDNEGDAWNWPTIFNKLTPEGQQIVAEIEEVSRDLIIQPGDMGEEANRRGLNQARKHGLDADFGPAQYDPTRNVGRIGRGDRWVDLSDPNRDEPDDDLPA